MPNKIDVILMGARGKMGQAIWDLLKTDSSFRDIFPVDPLLKQELREISTGDLGLKSGFLVINFTTPWATMEAAGWCVKNNCPLVTGTTGLNLEETNSIVAMGAHIPIVMDSNMSLGVNLIDALLPGLANTLAYGGWDTEITELHHRMKKDSPSGTAERFAKTMALATGRPINYGREKGHVDGRGNEIFVHSVRGGSIPGEHTIYFMGPDEVIEIHHRALSNKIFALGAVKAAKWIIGKEPGFYSMLDVLSLKK